MKFVIECTEAQRECERLHAAGPSNSMSPPHVQLAHCRSCALGLDVISRLLMAHVWEVWRREGLVSQCIFL